MPKMGGFSDEGLESGFDGFLCFPGLDESGFFGRTHPDSGVISDEVVEYPESVELGDAGLKRVESASGVEESSERVLESFDEVVVGFVFEFHAVEVASGSVVPFADDAWVRECAVGDHEVGTGTFVEKALTGFRGASFEEIPECKPSV